MRSFTKTVTAKQRAANRANSQKSTGPKNRQRQSNLFPKPPLHGFCGAFKVLPCEDQQAFDKLFDEFVASEKSANAVELELVRKMAEYSWLRQRATCFHESCFRVEEQSPEVDQVKKAGSRVNAELDKFIRYQAHMIAATRAPRPSSYAAENKGSYKRVASNRRNARKPLSSAAKNLSIFQCED